MKKFIEDTLNISLESWFFKSIPDEIVNELHNYAEVIAWESEVQSKRDAVLKRMNEGLQEEYTQKLHDLEIEYAEKTRKKEIEIEDLKENLKKEAQKYKDWLKDSIEIANRDIELVKMQLEHKDKIISELEEQECDYNELKNEYQTLEVKFAEVQAKYNMAEEKSNIIMGTANAYKDTVDKMVDRTTYTNMQWNALPETVIVE